MTERRSRQGAQAHALDEGGYARFLAERDHDEERRDRALLWILALPQLLWRKPWYSKRRPVVAGAEYHSPCFSS